MNVASSIDRPRKWVSWTGAAMINGTSRYDDLPRARCSARLPWRISSGWTVSRPIHSVISAACVCVQQSIPCGGCDSYIGQNATIAAPNSAPNQLGLEPNIVSSAAVAVDTAPLRGKASRIRRRRSRRH